jgi:hypothetical protein
MFTIFQRGFVAHPFFMIVNDPSAYGDNRFPLMPSQSAGPGISGIIDSDEIFNPGTENIDFDAPFTLAFAASWPVANTATTATLDIPAYNPDDYGVGGGDFTVGPGISGNWYNRDQSGHGFVIEMLPNGGMLADWYVFAPEGGATWIIAQGSADGDTAVLDAYQKVGSGGRFPPDFDASRLENRFWGTITFTFDDCNNGVASWESVVPGYSNGSMAITRLTMPAGLSCQ